ncbi:PREDICTED: uncharacterized protein LOC106628363 isoform X2 [Pseudopodoces humilis]|uniref:uncharacterized protein LOC106628363 isoform X2 n=1 Tax=Pseudopodoces humilis TaxID=181119 RepID=UPI0006B74399|nr:PREDICTED: uncharacterized protein LOC106628363 isoform X2 [Pseudopodoces humilis]
MDSPHLLHLGFLLLALAALCPSIAMPTVGPAEGSTTVTVYHCKDYKSCTCKSRENNFKNFTIIAETQNKTFSDVLIELVTNETHMTVCFEQENSCLEGIYGVFWQKAGGAGLSCGILNYGENGRGNINTEEKNICCEAETNIWRHNPTLRCYTQKSHSKPITLPVESPGNPELLTSSKKTSIGILLSFLFVGVCAGCAATYYFLWRRRGQALSQYRQTSNEGNLEHL